MNSLQGYVENYFKALKGIVKALPKTAILPPCLSNTSFIIGYSDIKGKLAIQLLSHQKSPEIILNGKTIKPKPGDEPGIICFSNTQKIENSLFPQDTKGTSVSMTINQQNVVLKKLVFSSKQYSEKYWANQKFYRICAGDIPFSVTENGVMLGLNLLWGTELNGAREEKLFEFVKIFGSPNITPTTEAEIQNEAFRDFGHSAGDLGENLLGQWSFTNFISSLEGPVEENVLILGSYKSDDEFDHLKNVLSELGYRGFLLKNSPDLPIQNNLEKLFTAIICSCFVIVLDKEASGHIGELGNILQFRFRPVIVIRDTPRPTTSFLEDQIATDSNFKIVVEPNITAINLLPHIQWAKSISAQKIEAYNKINYWRNK